MRALQAQGMGAVRLITHTDPAEQLAARRALLRCAAPPCNVVGVHLFSFGGVAATAAWMNRLINRLAQPAPEIPAARG